MNQKYFYEEHIPRNTSPLKTNSITNNNNKQHSNKVNYAQELNNNLHSIDISSQVISTKKLINLKNPKQFSPKNNFYVSKINQDVRLNKYYTGHTENPYYPTFKPMKSFDISNKEKMYRNSQKEYENYITNQRSTSIVKKYADSENLLKNGEVSPFSKSKYVKHLSKSIDISSNAKTSKSTNMTYNFDRSNNNISFIVPHESISNKSLNFPIARPPTTQKYVNYYDNKPIPIKPLDSPSSNHYSVTIKGWSVKNSNLDNKILHNDNSDISEKKYSENDSSTYYLDSMSMEIPKSLLQLNNVDNNKLYFDKFQNYNESFKIKNKKKSIRLKQDFRMHNQLNYMNSINNTNHSKKQRHENYEDLERDYEN